MKVVHFVALIIVLGLFSSGAARPPQRRLRAGRAKENIYRRGYPKNVNEEDTCDSPGLNFKSSEASRLLTPSTAPVVIPSSNSTDSPVTSSSGSSKNSSSAGAEFSTSLGAATQDKLWGLNYSPFRVGRCSTPEEIKVDLALVASVASNIRLFSMNDCNNAEIVLENLPSGMQVMLGIWLASFEPELATLTRLAKIQGFQGKVSGVSVGSEVIYRKEIASTDLITKIRQVRSALAAVGQPSVKITCSEPLQMWNPDLLNAVDILFPTIYPFFAKLDLGGSIAKTIAWMAESIASGSLAAKPLIISEIGWPSSGPLNGAAKPLIQNEVGHTRQVICIARNTGLKYYLFEAFDAAWKTAPVNPWEPSFGVFNANRTRKISWGSGGC